MYTEETNVEIIKLSDEQIQAIADAVFKRMDDEWEDGDPAISESPWKYIGKAIEGLAICAVVWIFIYKSFSSL